MNGLEIVLKIGKLVVKAITLFGMVIKILEMLSDFIARLADMLRAMSK